MFFEDKMDLLTKYILVDPLESVFERIFKRKVRTQLWYGQVMISSRPALTFDTVVDKFQGGRESIEVFFAQVNNTVKNVYGTSYTPQACLKPKSRSATYSQHRPGASLVVLIPGLGQGHIVYEVLLYASLNLAYPRSVFSCVCAAKMPS